MDWQMYNVEDNDKKLLDLTISYGEAFPMKNEYGDEIIPPWSGKSIGLQ